MKSSSLEAGGGSWPIRAQTAAASGGLPCTSLTSKDTRPRFGDPSSIILTLTLLSMLTHVYVHDQTHRSICTSAEAAPEPRSQG